VRERTTEQGLVVIEHRGDVTPNDTFPPESDPGTVGVADTVIPGDPHGVEIVDGPAIVGGGGRSIIRPSPWSGWPAEWATPNWYGRASLLTDTAWTCLDSNSSILSTMPPYFVGAAPTLNADWINNPDPDLYSSWEEFAKQLFWDYQGLGEVFVLATAYYATTWPARFHVVPPWLVNVELDAGGRRRYSIGSLDVTADILHIRYTSRVGDAHGHGPLEVGAPRLVAAAALARYASTFATAGGVPNSVLVHPQRLSAKQATDLQEQWVEARMSTIGLPAVLSGGVDFKTLSFSPKDLALVELANWNEARIAVLLRVPPFCVGLPSGGDSMTYSNVSSLFDYRWRDGLRPMAQTVMAALSLWVLPRGTAIELDRDEFIRPDPYQRAQTAEIWQRIGALSADEIRQQERFGARAAAAVPALPVGVIE
jgi:HK97 family phage portal protein